MAQAQAETRVALLGTVVLLLDEEAEDVGRQLLRLSLVLDPVARARLQVLRVRGDATGRLLTQSFTDDTAQGPSDPARALMGPNTLPQLRGDPGATQAIRADGDIALGPPQDFEAGLRGAVQEALRSAGTEPLSAQGYALSPNELAVHIVGRADAPLLAPVVGTTEAITRAISSQTDARRFALLIAASPEGETDRATVQPTRTSVPLTAQSGKLAPWQERAQAQPWADMLSWRTGEPPLLYAFMFESWDEAGRYHERPQLHYTVAEALFALFATGLLDHPQLREALDLSTAAMEGGNGLTRVGSIGTSLITSPTQGMVDYLAHRLAADALLRRGLIGEEGSILSPDLRDTLPAAAQQDAERWLATTWQTRVYPDIYDLPKRLPARETPDGPKSTWHPVALSAAGPSPAPLLWRWDRARLPINDARFWNQAVQNEYETAEDTPSWEAKAEATYASLGRDLQGELDRELAARLTQPEGIERARAFTRVVRGMLASEQQRLTTDQAEQEQYLDRHYRVYEDLLRRSHQAGGIPTRMSPPPRPYVPQMPRNLEALSKEVLDQQFARVPLPGTMIVVALVLAIFGAFAVSALPHVGGFAGWPAGLRDLATGTNARWAGAAAGLVLFALGSLGAFARYGALRRWQRRYVGERLLQHLAAGKTFEREQMHTLINGLLAYLDDERTTFDQLTESIRTQARALDATAAQIARDYAHAPSLAHDVYVSHGEIWAGGQPDALYLQLRGRQPEGRLVIGFLQYVQTHANGVQTALENGQLAPLALRYMVEYLRTTASEDPFDGWSPETAGATLTRAIGAARVALAAHPGGRPLGMFAGVLVHPSVAYLPRMAAEQHLAVLAAPSPNWCFVTRVLTRAQHPLVAPPQNVRL